MAVDSVKAAERRRHEQKIRERRATFTFIGILLFAFAVFGVWIMTYEPATNGATLEATSGDTEKISNVHMASELCEAQAQLNYQGKLVHSAVDNFSSRYDEPRNLFVILMRVSVLYDQKPAEEFRVHCHVIPEHTEVDYFKGFPLKT